MHPSFWDLQDPFIFRMGFDLIKRITGGGNASMEDKDQTCKVK
jgi:hypothetical protein